MNYVLFLLALFTFGIGFSQEKTDTIQVYFELNSSDISQSMEDEIWELWECNDKNVHGVFIFFWCYACMTGEEIFFGVWIMFQLF